MIFGYSVLASRVEGSIFVVVSGLVNSAINVFFAVGCVVFASSVFLETVLVEAFGPVSC